MKLNTGTYIYNTETCTHTKKIRVTREELTPRTYAVKTEQLCHQSHNKNNHFLIVSIQKYIDEQLTSTYSWIQTLEPDELQEFLDLPDYKPDAPVKPDRKAYKKQWNEQHKEHLKELSKNYYEQNKEKIKERSKNYYYEHKEKEKERVKNYYEQHKDRWQKYYLNKKKK